MTGDQWGQPHDKMPALQWVEDIASAVCLAAIVAVFVALVVGLSHA